MIVQKNHLESGGHVRVENLVAGYGKLVIVHGVSFDLDPNEIIALLGPNGSGKSTILKAILGLVDIRSGKILLDGENIAGKHTEQIATRRIAYVPQRDNVFPNLTVRENLEIGAITMKDKREVREHMENVMVYFPQLKEYSSKKAGKLSGGQRQMLALARGLILRPKILLLDEPTAALAPQVVTEVLSKVREIGKTGVTVLLVEQNAREAMAVCDRAIVLASGSIIAEGKPSDIQNNTDLVRLFLGVV